MRTKSLFSKIKFENDGKHLYFIKREDLQVLEGDTPLIIHGPRGTGKTTLLNSLNWKEHESNSNLKNALQKIGSRRDYIGVYLKVPELKVGGLKKWECGEKEIYNQIFSYYIELVWLEELTIAIAEMAVEGRLAFTPSEEKDFIDRVVNGRVNLFSETVKIRTLYDFSDELRKIRRNIENASLFSEDIGLVYEPLSNFGQIGFLGKYVCKELATLIGGSPSGDPYKFKICMDECECLSSSQTKVVNTLVRLSTFPVFYVFSFVRLPVNISFTLIDNITNQAADVKVIDLGGMTNDVFKELAEGVATVRIHAELGENIPDFSTKKIFGEISINELLRSRLSASVSKKAKSLLSQAKKNVSHPFFEFYKKGGLPIYQTYLVNELSIDIDQGIEQRWEQRRQESKEIRKRMVVAYLSILRELGIDPIYAYSEMILGICDKSIRDFLSQMDEIYKTLGCDLETFISSHIEVDIQDKGIMRASQIKFDSIPSSPISSPGGIGRLVYGLAYLTSLIQTSSNDNSHLRSSERGRFVIHDFNKAPYNSFVDQIIEAAEAGFLKIVTHGERVMKFRIHTSLSPTFGISYRGAYYDTQLRLRHLSAIFSAEDRASLEKTVKEIARDIYDVGESPQMTIGDL